MGIDVHILIFRQNYIHKAEVLKRALSTGYGCLLNVYLLGIWLHSRGPIIQKSRTEITGAIYLHFARLTLRLPEMPCDMEYLAKQ
jgi:hypothetical protein